MSFFGKYYFCHSRDLSGEPGLAVRDLLSKSCESAEGLQEGWTPAVDMVETEAGILVTLEMAGVHARDLEITVTGARLAVRGKRCEPACRGKREYRILEIARGAFERTLDLPAPVNAKAATAHLADGMLEIRLPRAATESAAACVLRIDWRRPG